MKKQLLITLTCMFACTITVLAQQDQSEIVKKAAKSTCECYSKKNLDIESISRENLQMELGFCIITAYNNDQKAIKEIYGDLLADATAMEKFGTDVGLQMATECPDTLLEIGSQYLDENEDEETYQEGSIVTGKIDKITTEQFIVVNIKDDTGRRYKLYWLDYFEGDSYILNALNSKDRNTYSFEYVDIELFDPSTKEYRDYKVLSNVSEVK